VKITIVNGFFLPVPPVSGGSTEKSWYHLAREFAAQGHRVTAVSRRWPGMPDEETHEGVHHLRLRGFDHRRKLWQNLFLDFLWSWRAFFALPTADIVIVNAVTLPMWLGWLKPRAGKVVIMTGRMPKGQYRRYRNIARVLAASSYVQARVIAENSTLAPVARVHGYPINWPQLSQHGKTANPFQAPAVHEELCFGYIGRIHEEKGLRLLAAALKWVSEVPDLPPWQLLMCGPADIARGGSGEGFRTRLLNELASFLPAERFQLLEPQFNDSSLAKVYRRINVFCYPSLAEQGETFGVAVAEAMAAGAVPVVSRLACFTDFVHDGENGLTFNHAAPDAARQLADVLLRLLRDPALRERLATTARASVRCYDYPRYAATLLEDFTQLTNPANPPTSPS
jgi:glycosyltransferase involved in cell wall biosynthesis